MASVPQQIISPAVTVGADELSALHSTVVGFDRDQLIWSSGYLAGLAGSQAQAVASPSNAPAIVSAPSDDSWTIFYATETGNSRDIAENLAAESKAAGIAVEVQDLRDYRPKALTKINKALFVVATHGIGEPPEGTESFFDFWFSKRAPRLESLEYSILALGDSSYVDFCEIGRSFDERLKNLGANPVVVRSDCDLDFAEPVARWSKEVVQFAGKQNPASAAGGAARPLQLKAVRNAPLLISKESPYLAEIVTRQRITGARSSKNVQHVELDIEDSGLSFLPGDSLGVLPSNPPQLIEAILGKLNFAGDEPVSVAGESLTLREALLRRKEITQLSKPILDVFAEAHPRLQNVLRDRASFSELLETKQLIDLIFEYPKSWDPQEFVDALRNLTPRSYSIASSIDAIADEVHLTVAVVNYEAYARHHWGAASNFLLGETERAPVHVVANEQFRLPENTSAPIIMVGAGTGVAPYRAFLQYRQAHAHSGDNWLVFGDRTGHDDFLYQMEWLRYRKDGLLTKLDLAFSRDQEEKVYVQSRLLDNAKEVYDWLERGAFFYVCGDAKHMAADVHQALFEVVRDQGAMSPDSANDYLAKLRSAGRYQKDVY